MVHWSKIPGVREETLKKISEGRKGKQLGNTNGFKKGKPSWNKDLPKEQQPRYGKPASEKQREACRETGKLKHPVWNTGMNSTKAIICSTLRQEIYDMKGNRCEFCGILNEVCFKNFGRRLDIHHKEKIYGDLNKRHSKGNLILVCRSCHAKIHMTSEEARKRNQYT